MNASTFNITAGFEDISVMVSDVEKICVCIYYHYYYYKALTDQVVIYI